MPPSLAPMMILLVVVITLTGIPMWMRMVPRNRFYGFRTPRTLADDEAWYEANAVAGRDLVIGGIVGLVAIAVAWGLGHRDPQILVICAVIPSALATLHSFGAVRNLPVMKRPPPSQGDQRHRSGINRRP